MLEESCNIEQLGTKNLKKGSKWESWMIESPTLRWPSPRGCLAAQMERDNLDKRHTQAWIYTLEVHSVQSKVSRIISQLRFMSNYRRVNTWVVRVPASVGSSTESWSSEERALFYIFLLKNFNKQNLEMNTEVSKHFSFTVAWWPSQQNLKEQPFSNSFRTLIETVVGWIISPKRYGHILTPDTHRCDLCWK